MYYSFILFLFLILFGNVNAAIPEMSFKATVSGDSVCVVRKGERLYVQFKVSSKEEAILSCTFVPPIFEDFNILKGPVKSESSNIEVLKGETQTENVNTYTYLLVAIGEGIHIIPSAVLECNGKKLSSNPLKINVLSEQAKPQEKDDKIAHVAPNPVKIIFKVIAPDSIKLNSQFRLSYEVNVRNGKYFKSPVFDGFEVINGPVMKVSTSTVIENGKTAYAGHGTYAYILKSLKEGIQYIPVATIVVDGILYESQPQKITVF